jgi:hypothetical protein
MSVIDHPFGLTSRAARRHRALTLEALESRIMLSGASLVAQFESAGATVSVYDTDDGDIQADDVEVRFGSGGYVSSIRIDGPGGNEGLGIVISGASSVGSVKDVRGGDQAPIAFIASDAPIKSISLRSGIVGYNLNGQTLGGLAFAADVDGDGDDSDATAIYCEGTVRTIKVDGDVEGDIWLGGCEDCQSLTTLRVKNGGLGGDLVTAGGAKKIDLRGDLTGSMDIAGALAGLSIKGGDLNGQIRVGDDLVSLKVKTSGGEGGDVGADARIFVADHLNKLSVAGSVQGLAGGLGDMVQILAGSMGSLSVKGDVENACIMAGADLGSDWDLGGSGDAADIFSAGRVHKVSVKGDVINSAIGAGWQPNGDGFDLQWMAVTNGFLDGSAVDRVKIGGELTSTADDGVPFGVGACQVLSTDVDGDGTHPLVFSDASWPPEFPDYFEFEIPELADCPVAQALGIPSTWRIDLPDVAGLLGLDGLEFPASIVLLLPDLPETLVLELPDFPDSFEIELADLPDCPILDMLEIGDSIVIEVPDLCDWFIDEFPEIPDSFVIEIPDIPDTIRIELPDCLIVDLLDLEGSFEIDLPDLPDTIEFDLSALSDCPLLAELDLPETLVIDLPELPDTITIEIVS